MIGVVGGEAKKVKGVVKAVPVATDKGDAVANLGRLEDGALGDTLRVLLLKVRLYFNVCCHIILGIIYEICATIFSAKNFKTCND